MKGNHSSKREGKEINNFSRKRQGKQNITTGKAKDDTKQIGIKGRMGKECKQTKEEKDKERNNYRQEIGIRQGQWKNNLSIW